MCFDTVSKLLLFDPVSKLLSHHLQHFCLTAMTFQINFSPLNQNFQMHTVFVLVNIVKNDKLGTAKYFVNSILCLGK